MAVEELTLADLQVSTSGPCKVGRILALLTETERATVEAALSGPREKYPFSTIAAALSKRILPISDHSIARHSGGTCACD